MQVFDPSMVGKYIVENSTGDIGQITRAYPGNEYWVYAIWTDKSGWTNGSELFIELEHCTVIENPEKFLQPEKIDGEMFLTMNGKKYKLVEVKD